MKYVRVEKNLFQRIKLNIKRKDKVAQGKTNFPMPDRISHDYISEIKLKLSLVS